MQRLHHYHQNEEDIINTHSDMNETETLIRKQAIDYFVPVDDPKAQHD